MRALTHIKLAAAFPTDHRLHAAPPANRLTAAARKAIAEADVILALEWLDLGGTLKQSYGANPVTAKVIQVSCDVHAHRGWSMDYQMLPPADLNLMCESDAAVLQLLQSVKPRAAGITVATAATPPAVPANAVTMQGVAAALRTGLAGSDFCIARLPLGWNGAYLPFRHPLDYIGFEGGAGVGAGVPITVGAALALHNSGRLPIGLMGDGDFLMGNTAVWTAVHYKIPCLMIVCNNRSYFNDERHQEAIAVKRGRPAENRWIGLRIDDPDIDIATIARGQGATGIGPIKNVAEVGPAIAQGIATVRAGGVCVIDMRVQPGYDAE